MDELFPTTRVARSTQPLADRMRPRTLDEIVGQPHLVGPTGALRLAIHAGRLPSLIFWGPPGSGKTSLAQVIAAHFPARFHALSAVLAGVKELRDVAHIAVRSPIILFVDEIHRFNKAQQDALLPHIEYGAITLIGATTENPSFEVIGPLLSRAKVCLVHPLTAEDIRTIVTRALADSERGLGTEDLQIAPDALRYLCAAADGDGRRALNTVETAATLRATTPQAPRELTLPLIEQALQQKALRYDKGGEEHYNIISAFIKSLRGSDPDAALYWLARMLAAGEDPLFCCRRMVIFASEDIGNADPQALPLAVATMQAFDFVGMPEGWIPLAQCATYLAGAPKSNASYLAYLAAKADVESRGALPVPLHLRNAPTKLMRELDYGKGYQYPHDNPGHHVRERYLPDTLKTARYYEPTDQGAEAKLAERLK
ncbi:MAG: replication-associated recombination protein A, partial [Deltaproteobacteria bacterium]|nr:replication-associated recombination protein A [Deltaproteobacteria bacterium]